MATVFTCDECNRYEHGEGKAESREPTGMITHEDNKEILQK